MDWRNNNNNSNSSSSCQGVDPPRQDIYDMNNRALLTYFRNVTYKLLEQHGTIDENFFTNVEYMPYRCLFVENKAKRPGDVSRVNNIGLWASMFASIGYIYDEMKEKKIDPEQLRVAFERVTHVCALLLQNTSLSTDELKEIVNSDEYRYVERVLKNNDFKSDFTGPELDTVRNCFSLLGVNILTLGMGDINLGSSEFPGNSSSASAYPGNSSSASAYPGYSNSPYASSVNSNSAYAFPVNSNSASAIPGAVSLRPSSFGADSLNIFKQQQQQQFQQQQLQKQQQEQQEQQWQQQNKQLQEQLEEERRRNYQLQIAKQKGWQQQQEPEPNWEVPDSVAQYLNFPSFQDINSVGELDRRVNELLRSPRGKTVANISTAQTTIKFYKGWDGDDEMAGGKRRTIKTKKRNYKKVKKTRMRRNNKSKRVFKGKKDKR